MIFDFQLLW